VHLTVDTVRYEIHGRTRNGVCSNFLADRVGPGMPVPVFIQPSKHFRPPSNGDLGMIMVGPGTGIAPFRAFLQERKATGAKGGNWLFFGAQRSSCDFFYKEELEAYQRQGVLTRLDTAFSRDQDFKIYVQHRMVENAKELWNWLEQGAHFYVCGDASRMAKDVDKALHEMVEADCSSKTCFMSSSCSRRLQDFPANTNPATFPLRPNIIRISFRFQHQSKANSMRLRLISTPAQAVRPASLHATV